MQTYVRDRTSVLDLREPESRCGRRPNSATEGKAPAAHCRWVAALPSLVIVLLRAIFLQHIARLQETPTILERTLRLKIDGSSPPCRVAAEFKSSGEGLLQRKR